MASSVLTPTVTPHTRSYPKHILLVPPHTNFPALICFPYTCCLMPSLSTFYSGILSDTLFSLTNTFLHLYFLPPLQPSCTTILHLAVLDSCALFLVNYCSQLPRIPSSCTVLFTTRYQFRSIAQPWKSSDEEGSRGSVLSSRYSHVWDGGDPAVSVGLQVSQLNSRGFGRVPLERHV